MQLNKIYKTKDTLKADCIHYLIMVSIGFFMFERRLIMNKNQFIRGNKILFASPHRLSKEERQLNIYYYDVRHADDDGFELETIEGFVFINFFATIGMEEPFSLTDENDIIVLNEKEKDIILSVL